MPYPRGRTLFALTLGAACLLMAAALYLATPPGDILVGFSGPLEGKFSDLGVEGRNAAQLAIEDINAAGGIDGRRLRLVTAHDGYTQKDAVEADSHLAGQRVAAVIGHMTSSQQLAVMAVHRSVVYVSPTVSTYQLTGMDDNFFRVIADNDATARDLGLFAASRGVQTAVALLDTVNEDFSRTFINAAARGFTSAGGTVVNIIPFSSSVPSSLLDAAASAADSGAQAVFVAASARDTAFVLAQMAQNGFSGPKFSSTWALTPALIAQGGTAVEDTFFCHPYPTLAELPAHRNFNSRFSERFGWEPSFPGLFAYTAVRLLQRGLEKTQGRTAGLREALKSIRQLDGLCGPITLDAYGDAHMPFFISTVRNGAFEPVR